MSKKLKICIVVIVVGILLFLLNYALSRKYLWLKNSPEYALYQVYISEVTGNTRIYEYYASDKLYEYLYECFLSDTKSSSWLEPEKELVLLKNAWLNNIDKNGGEMDPMVKEQIDYAFSHIIDVKFGPNKSINDGKILRRLYILRKPKIASNMVDYSITFFIDAYEYVDSSYTFEKEDGRWKLIKYKQIKETAH